MYSIKKVKKNSKVLKEIAANFFSIKLLKAIKVLLIDIPFQTRLFKADRIRWFSHICLAGGFMLLLLMHALDELVTKNIFPGYESTLNPYLLFRNLFGAFVLLGIIFSFYRRFIKKETKQISGIEDRFLIILLSVVLFSGFLLESVKIISYPIFDEMVEDYFIYENKNEIKPLESYWAKEYGVIFNDRKVSISDNLIAAGKQIHMENCAGCHSKPDFAFISKSFTGIMSLASTPLNKFRADKWLWYIHFLACFIALAYLPFSKFFHIFSIPINLIVQILSKNDNIYNFIQQNIGFDACTHCGVCTIHCSVAPIYRIISNTDILPSEKIMPIKKMQFGKNKDAESLAFLSQGNQICTECYRCTEICPSGIRLQDMWLSSKKILADKGFPAPHIWIRELTASQWAEKIQAQDFLTKPILTNNYSQKRLLDTSDTFTPCIQCTICTNVCPVVYAVDNPAEDLDYTPQQVMNLLRLSLKELALGSRMVWNCVTCYLCQENCPQGIRVADIMYELRNMACDKLSLTYIQNSENKNNSSLDFKKKARNS